MAFEPANIDFGGLLGLNDRPNPYVLAQQQQQIDLARQQEGRLQQAAQAKVDQEAAYQADVAGLFQAPPEERFARIQELNLKYPGQSEAFKNIWDRQDETQKTSNFRDLTHVYGLLDAGRTESATKWLNERITAGKAAGQDVSEEEEILAIAQENPGKAAAFVGRMMGAVEPEKFASVVEQLRLGQPGSKLREVAPGAVIIDEGEIDPETGRPKVLFENPLKPEIVGSAESGYSIVRPGTVSGNGTPGTVRYKNGWAPRARNGGDNSDASVDNYIAHVAGKLGIGPDSPISEAQLGALAAGMAEFESGGNPNALSVRNNNPGNIRKNGEFVKYPTLAAGQAAQRDLLRRYFGRGQNTVRSIIEGVPVSGGSSGAGPSVTPIIPGTGPGQKDAPSGYRWKADGTLEAIPGGPGDNKYGAGNRKAETDLRKEFNNLPDVQKFNTVRGAWQQVDSLANKREASATDDIALIFSYMRMLDPASVVREGEFATAQNAAGVPDRIRNQYNKVLSGNRLTYEQRQAMKQSAATVYLPIRQKYNETARQYQGYARDYGFDPNRIAREYLPTRGRQPSQQQGAQGGFRVLRVRPKQ